MEAIIPDYTAKSIRSRVALLPIWGASMPDYAYNDAQKETAAIVSVAAASMFIRLRVEARAGVEPTYSDLQAE
jgi:hypothetical protein